MPNTQPPIDSRSVVEFVLAQAREHGAVPVYPIGCVSQGPGGVELAEMGDMAVAGARGFSDDGRPVASAGLMRRALEYARIFDLPVIDHCEEPTLVAGGVVHEGRSRRGWASLGGRASPRTSWCSATSCSRSTRAARVHIAHLSTGRAADLVRRAKGSEDPRDLRGDAASSRADARGGRRLRHATRR